MFFFWMFHASVLMTGAHLKNHGVFGDSTAPRCGFRPSRGVKGWVELRRDGLGQKVCQALPKGHRGDPGRNGKLLPRLGYNSGG